MVKSRNPEHQPLWDALPSLVTRAQQFLEALFGSKYKIKYDDHDTGCDPTIEIDGYGIGVAIMEGSQPSILGSVPRIEYGAYETMIVFGRMYYPDGSGDPDSYDLNELGEASPNMDKALMDMLKGLVDFEIRLIQDREAGEAEAKYFEELDKLVKDREAGKAEEYLEELDKYDVPNKDW